MDRIGYRTAVVGIPGFKAGIYRAQGKGTTTESERKEHDADPGDRRGGACLPAIRQMSFQNEQSISDQ